MATHLGDLRVIFVLTLIWHHCNERIALVVLFFKFPGSVVNCDGISLSETEI